MGTSLPLPNNTTKEIQDTCQTGTKYRIPKFFKGISRKSPILKAGISKWWTRKGQIFMLLFRELP